MSPKLSIVLASHNARATIELCLNALKAQGEEYAQRGEKIEVVIVDNSTDGTALLLEQLLEQLQQQAFIDFHLVRRAASLLIPELWEIGINESQGDIVALTTAHCIPAADWIERILKAHEKPHAGIGGAIENAPDVGSVQWAIYFCRYSPYMLPFAEAPVDDMAADNASYKREALDCCRDVRRHGFWEPAVHRCLLDQGWLLLKTPSVVVHHKSSFSLLSFMKQRFQHGRKFGQERAARFSPQRRLIYILLSPAIPAIFLTRIARRVLPRRRHATTFGRALPALLLFLLSWSLGELSGYLNAPPG